MVTSLKRDVESASQNVMYPRRSRIFKCWALHLKLMSVAKGDFFSCRWAITPLKLINFALS